MESPTYLITKSQIESVFSMKDYVSTVETAFRLYGNGKVQMPPKVYLSFPLGDVRCMPVYLPTLEIAGVKNVNVHPGNKDIPTVMATITLFHPATGLPLAVMDGTYITSMRTGAAGGIAAKYLSRENSKIAAFVGAGVQARTQLEALLVTRPQISFIKVYDPGFNALTNFGLYLADRFKITAILGNSLEDTVKDSDIIVTTTPVRKPIIKLDWVNKGAHINAIGADAAGKQELESQIVKNAKVVIDNWEQASHSGEINVPVSEGILKKEDIHANIGEVVTGRKVGRASPDEITIFDSTGLAIQDISCAYEIYKKLTSDKELEKQLQRIDFLK